MTTNFKQRKQRQFEEIEDIASIVAILESKFLHKKLKIKYDIEERELEINEVLPGGYVMGVVDETYKPGTDNLIMVYGLIDKYIEVDLQVEEELGPGYYKCHIKGGRKASTGRGDLRFKVNGDDAVVTNFRVSKHTIDVTTFTLPTSIKVVLDQYEGSNRNPENNLSVGYFDSNDPVLTYIKKSGKTLHVENMDDPESYNPMTDDFVDLRQVLGKDFDVYTMKYREKKVKSLLVVPIIYITDSEQSIPFAFIRMMSRERLFGLEDVLTMKEETFKLVDRIRDANTMMLTERQKILNISRSGMRLMIDNDDLKRSLLRTKGFIFNIVFKLQAPITIYGEIKFTGSDDDGNLILGLSFAGNSSRKDEMKRLYSILEPMEVEYKKRLIMSMKRK